MTDQPGHLWALVQEWLDTFRYRPPSQRDLAKRLHISNSTFGDYKYGRSLPPPIFLVRLAAEMQVPYEKVLDAALHDQGYRGSKLDFHRGMAGLGPARTPAQIDELSAARDKVANSDLADLPSVAHKRKKQNGE